MNYGGATPWPLKLTVKLGALEAVETIVADPEYIWAAVGAK